MKSWVLLVLLILGVACPIYASSSDSLFNDVAEFGAMLEEQSQLQHDNELFEQAQYGDMAFMQLGEQADSDEDLKDQSSAEEELDQILLSVGDDEGGDEGGDEKPENPTYVLPYPPVLPGFYTPLFNPYTNVNPLSTPFANYAAQPGAHPGVAAASAANAVALAAAHANVANYAGYPGRWWNHRGPWAHAHPVLAGNLAGYPLAAAHPYGWIHPQNLNSAAVGENEKEEFPQFVEVEAQDNDGCINCQFSN